MRIMAICGSGLGSSFMLEMNVQQILRDMGVDGIEVGHSDLSSATPDMADLFILSKDIAEGAAGLGNLIVIESIIDMDGIRGKLEAALKERGYI
ncbi:PTS sugar transporter subunit IIB [Bacillus sp. JJ722]|uniref:PTS sugar transporter subunit IIB n=1 Tax=Bacillus sp. JJ722 TaxID=3122973 RepID=UPI003000673C